MLRICVVLSIVLHVLLFSIGSLIASQRVRKPPLIEKQFQINLRKEPLSPAQSPVQSVPALQPDRVKRELAPSRPELPVPESQGVKRHVHPPENLSVFPSLVQEIKKPFPDVPVVQAHSPDLQDALMSARQLPTPVPSPKPKPVATPVRSPRPKPTPARQPKQPQPTRSTPLLPSPIVTPIVEPTPLLSAAAPSTPEPSASPATTKVFASETTNPQSSPVTAPVAPAAPSSSGSPPAAKRTVAPLNEEMLAQYAQSIATKVQAALKYPAQARRKGWKGRVVIQLHLLPTGQVEWVEIVEQTPYQILNEAALQALSKAQPFPPITPTLKEQRIIVTIPIEFRLTP